MKIGKDVMKVTLICLVLVSALLGGGLVIVAAPEPTHFSIEATICELNPYFGYYGGYHDLWTVIDIELEKIGIDLTIEMWDDLEWWDQVWEEGWNYTGGTLYNPPASPGGWDVTMLEWWLQPHAIEPWFAAMTLNDQTPVEEGFNIHPWMNERADKYLLLGVHAYDAEERKYYLWKWQEEFMHDPPIAEIFYPRIYEIMGSYVLGYDPSGCWWYDIKHLDINTTKFEEVVGGGANPTRYAQGNDTIVYAITEGWWSSNPMYMETYTDEGIGCLVYDTLYTWSLDYTDEQWRTLAGKVEPNYWDYIIKPELAAGPPIDVDGDGLRMRVPLREGVLWSDGKEFNATDVKYTYDLTFTPSAKCSGVGDFAYAIESAEVVPLAEGLGGAWCEYTEQFINASAVDFILKQPHPDLTSILANDWGGGSIMPWHALGGLPPPDGPIGPGQIRGHESNNPGDYDKMLPSTGPFRVTDYVADAYVVLERNDLHWGYDLGFGPNVSRIIYQWYTETPIRLAALQENDVDLGEYPVASVDEYKGMMTWDNIRVFQYDYPASNGVWFNFDNRYLSNRYVRQAIAHAIPYATIASILTSWGIETAYPGKTYIQPSHYYTYGGTTAHLFNDELQPYEHSIAKATEYMKMWLYSNSTLYPAGSPEVAQGPVGDADFSGRVDLDDFWVWWKNYGKTPNQWPWIPGRDIDPDFNNDDAVTMADFDMWSLNYNKEYPFEGAR